MKRQRENFLHFSQIRGIIKKFAIVLLFIIAFVFMLLNKSENVLIEKTSGTVNEIVSSVVDVLVMPASASVKVYEFFRGLYGMSETNQRLSAENRRLTVANARQRALEIENHLLSRMLNYTPPPSASFMTAKVIAEEGNAFAHAVTVYTGDNKNIHKGQAVIGEKGVIGRVEKSGRHYAKIFLLNDINSKIPVIAERSRVRGILSGENNPLPVMMFIPLDAEIKVGDKIVTSGIGGVFPAGLPVGRVVSIGKDGVRVKPFDNLNSLEYVQIVDYRLADDLVVQDAPQ